MGSVGGGTVVTLKVTLTVCGLLVAPVEAMVTVPVYVPTARPAGLTLTVTGRGVLPPGGVAVSQLPPEVVDTLVVTGIGAPLLVTCTG